VLDGLLKRGKMKKYTFVILFLFTLIGSVNAEEVKGSFTLKDNSATATYNFELKRKTFPEAANIEGTIVWNNGVQCKLDNDISFVREDKALGSRIHTKNCNDIVVDVYPTATTPAKDDSGLEHERYNLKLVIKDSEDKSLAITTAIVFSKLTGYGQNMAAISGMNRLF
jgi:hypothetical protein